MQSAKVFSYIFVLCVCVCRFLALDTLIADSGIGVAGL